MQNFVDKLPEFFRPWGENILLNPFNFQGRTNRKDFWMTVLVVFIISLVTGWIPVIGWLISLAQAVCSISLYVRRLTDIGKPWPFIFMYFIPCAGPFILIYFFCQDSVA